MGEQLRKRLEEAAKKYQEEYETTERVAFTHGAVWGYKETIAQAKEWLKNTEHFYQGGSEEYPDVLSMYDTIEEMLADFEAYMNKFGEGEK